VRAGDKAKEVSVTMIRAGAPLVTLINVFTVEPERQQELVDLLVDATEAVMRRQPGFISANIHRSFDGQRVANYAQRRSREDFEAMLRNPEAQAHMRRAADVADSFEPHLYEVVFAESTAEG
jgi:antibiotic biosynthesis monooxygenase (ABM) superfamily enzyme